MPKDQQLQWKPRREKHNPLQFLATPEQAVSSKSQGFLCTPEVNANQSVGCTLRAQASRFHTDHPPGCLEFGSESPGPGEEQGSDCKGNQDSPGFFKSGLLISALAPMLCRVQVRKTWAKGLQSNQAWGLQPHTAHAHTRPLQHFISTCPHCCIHTPWSLPAGK